MHLHIWGRTNLAVMFTRPRITASFDGLEFGSLVVDETGLFEFEAVVPGDWLQIPARQRHRVTWTDPAQDTVWLAVHHD
mgnify:CR=1 FL=1